MGTILWSAASLISLSRAKVLLCGSLAWAAFHPGLYRRHEDGLYRYLTTILDDVHQCSTSIGITMYVFRNGNWTEWSAISAEIIRVISKSNERAVRSFDLKSLVRFQTKIAWHKVQLPLYYIHFEIAQIQDLISSNILLMQYWASLKLNSSIFRGGETRVLETKVTKFATWYSLPFIFLQLGLVTLNKPWNMIGCFVFSVASSLAGKIMRFKAKNGAIRK